MGGWPTDSMQIAHRAAPRQHLRLHSLMTWSAHSTRET